ncbi:MAG: hypothetical protein ABIG61_07300 [Planctomycetota bacterium]
MKRSELITHITRNLGNRSNDVTTYGVDWLNFALQDLAAIRNWRSMKQLDENSLKTVEGRLLYAMPTNIKDILEVHYVDEVMSKPLEYYTPVDFRKSFPHPENDGNGDPDIYTWESEHIKLYPIPSETGKQVHLFCVRWPTEFNSTDDDENPLDKLDYALIARACAYGATAEGDWAKRQVFTNICDAQVKKLARSDGHPSDYTPVWAARQTASRKRRGELIVHPIAVE